MNTFILAVALAAQPQTVTFTHPCAHSSVVLEALGKELGVKMAPGGSVLQDYFAVKFTDRDPETVKRLIAETLNAVWVQRGEYLVLDRGPVQHAAELKEENDLLRAQIEKYLGENPNKAFDLAQWRKRLLEMPDPENDPQAYTDAHRKLVNDSPIVALAPSVIKEIGIDRLLSIADGGLIRYSWPLTDGVTSSKAIESLIYEYNRNNIEAYDIAMAVGRGDIMDQRQGRTDPNRTFTIEARRRGVTLSVYLIESSASSEAAYSSGRLIAGFSARLPRPPLIEVGELEGRLEVSEPGLTLIRVARTKLGGERSDPRNTSAERLHAAIGLATDLKANELLSMYGCAPLTQVAEQIDRDYVALVGDSQALISNWMRAAESQGLEQTWTQWSASQIVRQDAATGTLLVSPSSVRLVREHRFDRLAASRFVSSFASIGRVSLTALGTLAVDCVDQGQFSNTLTFGLLFLPVSANYNFDFTALRVYGSLSGRQREEAGSGSLLLPWNQVPRAAQAAIAESLVNVRTLFFEVQPNAPDWSSGGVSFSGQIPPKYATLDSIPEGTVVRVTTISNSFLVPLTPKNIAFGYPSIEETARVIKSGQSNELRDFSHLTVADVERVQVDVFLPGAGYRAFLASADSVRTDAMYHSPDSLPEPWKSRLAEAIKKIGGQ